jgi:hypothetical protein
MDFNKEFYLHILQQYANKCQFHYKMVQLFEI